MDHEKKFIDNVYAKAIGNMIEKSPVWNSPDREFLSVSLTEYTIEQYNAWLADCYRDHLEVQKAQILKPDAIVIASWEAGYPYTGASGGEVTFNVTETSIGQCIVAVYTPLPDRKIDLTEYDLW